jgi:hypothetical protein
MTSLLEQELRELRTLSDDELRQRARLYGIARADELARAQLLKSLAKAIRQDLALSDGG